MLVILYTLCKKQWWLLVELIVWIVSVFFYDGGWPGSDRGLICFLLGLCWLPDGHPPSKFDFLLVSMISGMNFPCNIHQCQKIQTTQDTMRLCQTRVLPSLRAYQLVQYLLTGTRDPTMGLLQDLLQLRILQWHHHSIVNKVQILRLGSHHLPVIYATQET